MNGRGGLHSIPVQADPAKTRMCRAQHCLTYVLLQVLDAIMRFSDAQSEPLGGASQQVEVLQWASCIDETGGLARSVSVLWH